ncbi:TPA: replication endonuclease, partial [Klebsiella pneumoniae]
GNNCPPVEKMNYFEPDSPGDDLPEPLPDFQNMSRKERRELTARLRQVKPKRRKGYKQEINDQLRLQLEIELKSRGFDGSETEIDLLLRGGSIPSGAGLRLFYRNQRLQEDDKWRQWY